MDNQQPEKMPPLAPVGLVPTKEDIEKLILLAAHDTAHDTAVKVFTAVTQYAYRARASDIHFEPEEKLAIIRIRIDGILHDLFQLPPVLHKQIVAVLKLMTHMRTDEHRAPQDGRYSFLTSDGEVDVRASVIAVTNGEKIVLRLLSSTSHSLGLEELGFSEQDLLRVQRAIRRPWGMILSTGPTGSGKTTSIYAILEILNTREVNIATIEDPVEYDIEGVNQSQVDPAAKLTFAAGLRSIVRQDPDIIMVGEIRDEETASIAVNAALTGHKLLSTIHTNNSASTILRLLDMNVEPFLISSTLICAIAQRLVRRVCDDCHKVKELSREEVVKILGESLAGELINGKTTVAVAEVVGCATCNDTGYKGRIGIYEVLENTKTIQKLIIDHTDADTIEQAAIKEGMTTIAQDGVRKIRLQLTTLEELVRVMSE